MMKRVSLYIRVSTQEQAQEGYSVGEQKERLIAYCRAHDWVVKEIYADPGYSGSNLNRPGIQKLIADIKECDIVLVYKLDRLSRSQRDTLYLIEDVFLPNNTDFVSVQESFDTSTPFGKATIGLLAVFAQLEREQIKERTKMGRVARAKSGLYHGGAYMPIGYDYEDGKLIINSYEAEQIRKIYEWYIAGESLIGIAERLQKAGYTNRYGSWSSWSSVRNVINNELYIGKISFGEVKVENAHEAIISREQFEAAQAIQAKRHDKYGMTSFKSKHLLTGLVFCGHCGGRYYKRNTGKYNYYTCYSRSGQIQKMVKDPNCRNRNWKAEELEAIIEERVRELLHSPKMAEQLATANKPKVPTPVKNNKVEKRIHEIDRQINKLMELYQHDSIPTDVLSDKINKLYNEKTALQTSLEPVQTNNVIPFDLVLELISDAAQIWDFADVSQKRRVLQSLIRKITLTDDNIDIEWAFEVAQ